MTSQLKNPTPMGSQTRFLKKISQLFNRILRKRLGVLFPVEMVLMSQGMSADQGPQVTYLGVPTHLESVTKSTVEVISEKTVSISFNVIRPYLRRKPIQTTITANQDTTGELIE